jgi:hypothetical protein
MLVTNSIAWKCMLAIGLIFQFGQAHEKARRSSSEWMQVVEPRKKQIPSMEDKSLTPPAEQPALPIRHSKEDVTLTKDEMSKALALRLETQRALREIQAKKMAQHRRKGKATWNRELQTFLSGQRQIERSRVIPKKIPTLKQESEKKDLNPEGHPVRKGRAVLT